MYRCTVTVSGVLAPDFELTPASCDSKIDFLDDVVNIENLSNGHRVARANG